VAEPVPAVSPANANAEYCLTVTGPEDPKSRTKAVALTKEGEALFEKLAK
jgi:hypothetical protein